MRYEVGRFRRPMRRSTEGQLVGLVDLGDGSTLSLDFTAMSGLDSRFTFSRASTATFINSSGLVASAANGVARFDHDPATLAPRGLLIEASATNVLENFGSSGLWGRSNIDGSGAGGVLANGQTGPDGVANTAARITTAATTTMTNMSVSRATNAAGNTRTFSVWLRGVGANTTASIAINGSNTPTGVASSQAGHAVTLTTSTSGNNLFGLVTGLSTTAWTRVSISRTDTQATPDAYRMCPGDHNGTINSGLSLDVYVPQAESGIGMTSTIPTGSGTVQRAADECTMTGANFSSWFNATGGTFLAHARRIRTTDVGRIASANDNTANESIDLGASTTGQFIVTDGGSALATITPGTVTANTTFKIAGAFELNNVQAALNGTLGTADTSVTMPTVTQLHIGRQGGASPVYLNGTVSLLKYWPTRLPDATLQSLTQ